MTSEPVTDHRLADMFSAGGCHLFAIACHKVHGGGFVVALDTSEEHWVDDDGEPMMYAALHVYARLDTPDGPVLRDYLGDRPYDEAALKAECEDRFSVWARDVDLEDNCASGLLSYIADVAGVAAADLGVEDEGDLDAEDRPLMGYDAGDLDAIMGLPQVTAAPGALPAPEWGSWQVAEQEPDL